MLDALLDAIVADPQAEDRYLVLADWLEEHDDGLRAELLRLHRKLLATCCEPDLHPERAEWHGRVVELIGQGVRPCVPQRLAVLGEGVEMGFSFIPPGTFLMGSLPHEEGRVDDEVLHRVELTKGFWLGIYPVTQAQWQTVMGSNPSHFQGEDRPVEHVSWDDCVAFCQRLGEGFRLPTEAEWEYACRAGTTTAYYTGDGLDALKRAGWGSYDGERGSAKGTRAVGQFEPNGWDLYDLHGNVWEWVTDRYGPHGRKWRKYPQGPRSGVGRVLRGGSWLDSPGFCRSGFRSWVLAGTQGGFFGFRLCLCPDDQGS